MPGEMAQANAPSMWLMKPCDQLGLNKREAKDFVDAFFEILSAELAQGKSVKISGFGNFEVHTKSARPGRNPLTGEPVVIAARRVVTFKASAMLREQVKKTRLV